MIIWIILLIVAGIILSSIINGAPYVPVHRVNQKAVFELLDLKKDQVFYDLGSGDGKMLREAARRGYRAIGYEINPVLYVISRVLSLPFGSRITIRYANLWSAKLEDADGVAIFQMTHHMKRMQKLLENCSKNNHFKVACVVFELPDKKPSKSKDGVFLYRF